MHEWSSTLNNEAFSLLLHLYIADSFYFGDFGDFSIQPLCISMISSISVAYPYLQWWFWRLLYPTHNYISDFNDFHTHSSLGPNNIRTLH